MTTIYDVYPGMSVLDVVSVEESYQAHLRRLSHEIVAAIDHLLSRDGTFTAQTLRTYLLEERGLEPVELDKRMGGWVGALSKSGAITQTGGVALSGNARSRNTNRLMPVWKLGNPTALNKHLEKAAA